MSIQESHAGTSLSVRPVHPFRHVHSARGPRSDERVNRRPKTAHQGSHDSTNVANHESLINRVHAMKNKTFYCKIGTERTHDDLSNSEIPVPPMRRSSKPAQLARTDSVLTAFTDWDSDYDFDDEVAEERPGLPQYSPEEMYERFCKMESVIPCKRFIKQLTSPVIDVSNSMLRTKDVKAICVALLTNTFCRDLDLSGNDLGSRGTGYIVEALEENISVEQLNLNETSIGLEGLRSLAGLLLDMKPLRSLELSGNKLNYPHAEILREILEVNDYIQDLNLSNNAFEDGGVLLAKALAKNTGLKRLDLSWNHLRSSAAEAICKSLMHNHTLVELDLSWNGFAEEGCKALESALPVNHSLKELDLTCNRIGIFALGFLLQGLQKNDTLEVLRVDKNPLTTDGALAMVKTLTESTQTAIKSLYMMDIPINGEFIDAVDELRQRRPVDVYHRDPNKKRITTVVRERSLKDFEPGLILFEYMKEENMRLIDLFRTFDTDSSHSVSLTELKEGFKTLNLPLEEEALESLFENLDKNHDSVIEFDELKLGYRKTVRQFQPVGNEVQQARKDEMLASLHELIRNALKEKRQEIQSDGKKRSQRKSSLTLLFKLATMSKHKVYPNINEKIVK